MVQDFAAICVNSRSRTMHCVFNGIGHSLNITKIIKTRVANDYNLQLFTF
jgi:hypothetical protein